jgi:AmmeMemoRadiSam system protein B
LALERVAALDPEGLYRTVHQREISMCGVVPVTVALAAVRELGGVGCEVVAYGSSGDVTGDASSVVGYAGAFARWPA